MVPVRLRYLSTHVAMSVQTRMVTGSVPSGRSAPDLLPFAVNPHSAQACRRDVVTARFRQDRARWFRHVPAVVL